MPIRKWLIAAFYDEETDMEQIEQNVLDDVARYRGCSKKECPDKPELTFIWRSIDKLRLEGIFRNYDNYFVEHKVTPWIQKEFRNETKKYIGLTLLLDREMLNRNGKEDLFTPVIRCKFFTYRSKIFHFACCFGGTPNGMRDNTETVVICPYSTHGCSVCPDDETLHTCNHTCYWQLIGLLLGAFPKPRQETPYPDEDIREALPKTFIFTS
jgi:hypothetical protein